jgi:hypothetical protein
MSVRERIAGLDEDLGPLGFERLDRTWNRQSTRFVDVVDLQISKAADSVTLNVGVLDPDYEACWGTEASKIVDEPSCTVRTRIGHLLGTPTLVTGR